MHSVSYRSLCHRKRGLCHQMPNDIQVQNGIHLPDTRASWTEYGLKFYLNLSKSGRSCLVTSYFQLILTNICVAQFLQNCCNTSVRLGGEGRSFSSRLVFFFSKYFIDQISCAVLLIFISNFDLDTFGFSYLLIYLFV